MQMVVGWLQASTLHGETQGTHHLSKETDTSVVQSFGVSSVQAEWAHSCLMVGPGSLGHLLRVFHPWAPKHIGTVTMAQCKMACWPVFHAGGCGLPFGESLSKEVKLTRGTESPRAGRRNGYPLLWCCGCRTNSSSRTPDLIFRVHFRCQLGWRMVPRCGDKCSSSLSLSPGYIYSPGHPSFLSACLAGHPLHWPSPASSPCSQGAHCWHMRCTPAPSQQLLVKMPQDTWRALSLSSLMSYPTWKHKATPVVH